jgi:signal transduction histidine kinase
MALEPDFLRLSARTLELLSRERSLAIARATPELRVAFASENLAEFTSDAEPAVVGKLLSELFWELFGADTGLAAVLRGEEQLYRIENINRDQADGSVRYITLTLAAVDAALPEAGLLLIAEENTRLGVLEQQLTQERNLLRLAEAKLSKTNTALLRLNQIKSLFLSIAAHDLRAPLSVVRGYAELMQMALPRQAAPQNDQQEYLTAIISQANHLDRLITNILDLEQVEQGRLTIHLSICNLGELMREVGDAMQPVAMRQGIAIQIAAEENAVEVLADADRVRQILYNLLGNAVKYSPSGGEISLSCWIEGAQGVVCVRDSGNGIAEKDLQQIFELFHRTTEAIQSGVQGSGLGLYITKSLVDALGGSIAVTSRLGEGTMVTVSLPVSPMRG